MWEVLVRELIQNAVDTTLIQLYEDVMLLKKQEKDVSALTAEDILECIKELDVRKEKKETTYIKAEETSVRSKQIDIHNYDINGRFYEIDKNDVEKSNHDVNLLVDGEHIYESKKVVVFELEDSGTGISESEINAIIGLEGKSKALKKKIEKIPPFFRPSGAFGIGIQSVFQAAKRIVFITKTNDEGAKVITINDPSNKGDAYVRDYQGNMHRGTKVMVLMDPTKFTQNDFGKSDYAYNTTPINSLILTWLVHHSYNMEKDPAPGFEAARQKEDYFNILVKGYLVDETDERNVLYRKSILPEMAIYYKNHNPFSLDKGKLKYRYYDLKANCIFDAVFYSGYDNGIVNEGNTEPVVLGKCSDWNMRRDYLHNVFYRNVIAERNFGYDKWEDQGIIFGKYVDFRINLFSENAEEILNIGRNTINDSYNRTLVKIVNSELELLFKNLVDYCIKCEMKSERILFLAYSHACILDYMKDEMYSSKKELIDRMKVGNYFDINGDEVTISLADFFDNKVIFLRNISDKENKNIPEDLWSKIAKSDIKEEGIICQYNPVGKNGREDHFIVHILQKEYYANYKGEKYLVYETVPYKRNHKYGATDRNEFIRYQEFLYTIFNDLRCIIATKGFEILETPTSMGLTDSYHAQSTRAIEIMLAPHIKQMLGIIIQRNESVSNAVYALNDIKNTEEYKKNIDFIVQYHKKLNDEVSQEEIEAKYSELLQELLTLLANKDYTVYLNNCINEIRLSYTWGTWSGLSEFDYFSNYRIERFADNLE